MDHEQISTVFKKYKKEYVPKYLQQWTKLGKMNDDGILPLNDCELKSTVSEYPDGCQFVSYGEVIVWIGVDERFSSQPLILPVRLMDNMEKIKMQLKNRPRITDIELKSSIINSNTRPNQESWNEGRILKSNDTIISSQLYQENCIIMAKLIKAKFNTTDSLPTFQIFVKTLTGDEIQHGLRILRSAHQLYDNDEFHSLSLYVRHNRAQKGNFHIGDQPIDIELLNMQNEFVSLLSYFHSNRPFLIIAGSYT
ncbi:unnamed protein product [Rotaria sp. Silwood1]|nr:unnamed protein product [Rotaria sp. Silwood1]CAF4921106.1 unnamed protein product [Rotaria sp. Silwood1]